MRLRKFWIVLTGCTCLLCLMVFLNMAKASTSDSDGMVWNLVKEFKLPHTVFYAGFINDQYGVTVGYHGATHHTKDGGQTWVKGDNEANCRFGLDILDDNYLWTTGNYGGNRVSINGGNSLFATTDLPLIDDKPNNLINIIDQKAIWLASPLRLALTMDAGYTWKDIDMPLGCEAIAGISFNSAQAGYLMDGDGKLYHTVDGGVTWNTMGQLPIVKGIKQAEVPSVAMRISADQKGVLAYLDQDGLLYSYQIDIAASDASTKWNPIAIPEFKNCSPHISRDGKWLTVTGVMGNVKVLQLGQ